MKKYKIFALALALVTAMPITATGSEVQIDYKDTAADDIIITEAAAGMFEKGSTIALAVEKIDVSGDVIYNVAEGDIEVSAELFDQEAAKNIVDGSFPKNCSLLVISIEDESTEASKIVVSGLKLYLDRTLPSGGYALKNIYTGTGLWENSSTDEEEYNKNGVFKYEPINAVSNYIQVVTAPRDQDDSTLITGISINMGSDKMTAGTNTINLDSPAYINSEGYTMLPVRAVAEALGANVEWNAESGAIAIFSGKRIVSMTIDGKTMYINGTPVPMNTSPEISNGRVFIPVRDLAMAMGIKNVDWSEASSTVTLN